MNNPTTITAQPGTPFLETTREFDAPATAVFRAWTDPELLPRWLGPRDLEMEILTYEARTGGRYRYVHRGRGGDEHFFNGVFHTVTTDALIIQTFEWEGAPGEVCLERVTFTDLGGGRCRMDGSSVFGSVASRDAMVDSGMNEGILQSMERLDSVLTSVAA